MGCCLLNGAVVGECLISLSAPPLFTTPDQRGDPHGDAFFSAGAPSAVVAAAAAGQAGRARTDTKVIHFSAYIIFSFSSPESHTKKASSAGQRCF